MADKNDSGFVEPERADPSRRPVISQCVMAWLLAAIGVGFGFIAVASCGIPFVPPASTLAIVLGTMGSLVAVASVAVAFRCGHSMKTIFLIIGGVLLALNWFAISLGRMGKHLIDYLEGH